MVLHTSGKTAVLREKENYIYSRRYNMVLVLLRSSAGSVKRQLHFVHGKSLLLGKNFSWLSDKIKISKQFITESAIHHGDHEQ